MIFLKSSGGRKEGRKEGRKDGRKSMGVFLVWFGGLLAILMRGTGEREA
jgi:hypothetical protein